MAPGYRRAVPKLLLLLACAAVVNVPVDTGPDLDDVCLRWEDERADFDEGTWSGDAATCDPGAIPETAMDATLRNVNLYRWLAGLPAVERDAERDAAAQACSLMMQANGTLDHSPSSDWACYTDEGAQAAGNSNLATTASIMAVDLYMYDPGNETTLGHRRWILANSLGPIGVGGASNYSCLWVLGGSGAAGFAWMAWPPAGEVPLAAIAGVDATGWSIQSDTLTLDGAEVSVTRDGEELPVTTSTLDPGYGSNQAIKFIPDGWTTEAGTYAVTVTGASEPIAYEVVVRDCDAE